MLSYNHSALLKLWECITMIEAQEQLKNLSALDWPNMKKESRNKMHRDLMKKAYPFSKQKKSITASDLAKMLGGSNG